ncbi:hypothetical protein BT96DRAFT_989870 [Gymnopus androsaceus JB14]|uniref:Uncharacterized protein n=1 Tax=Gymnopus androsaceus JB14 TaxID=1447944 RepID=A0A6A4I544_9AGAR|nr:hypothetical protein BT96DRAFT_989870 [Gymnopus androsaceus JB14]
MAQIREHLRSRILAYTAMAWPLFWVFLDWKTTESKTLLIFCSFWQSYTGFIFLLGTPLQPRWFALALCFGYCYAGWFGPIPKTFAELDQAHLLYLAGSFIFAVAMALWDASHALDANTSTENCASEKV